MSDKLMAGECLNCESSFNIHYIQQMVSQSVPLYCPFCGESIDEINEEYIDDEDEFDDEDEYDSSW